MEWNEWVTGPIIIKSNNIIYEMRRQVSTSENALARKRARTGSFRGAVPKYRVPRPIRPTGAIIPVVVDHDFDLTADMNLSFSFDTENYYYNGTAAAIAGASEIAAVYDNMRVAKVEFTIIPSATGLDYSAQSSTTGSTNIPYVYHAVDYNDNTAPTIAGIRQLASCRTDSLNKVIRRTLYPRLEGSNGVVDMSTNYKNLFVRSGAASTQRWNGFKIYIDMKTVVWTYGSVRISMKVFYECKSSK